MQQQVTGLLTPLFDMLYRARTFTNACLRHGVFALNGNQLKTIYTEEEWDKKDFHLHIAHSKLRPVQTSYVHSRSLYLTFKSLGRLPHKKIRSIPIGVFVQVLVRCLGTCITRCRTGIVVVLSGRIFSPLTTALWLPRLLRRTGVLRGVSHPLAESFCLVQGFRQTSQIWRVNLLSLREEID